MSGLPKRFVTSMAVAIALLSVHDSTGQSRPTHLHKKKSAASRNTKNPRSQTSRQRTQKAQSRNPLPGDKGKSRMVLYRYKHNTAANYKVRKNEFFYHTTNGGGKTPKQRWKANEGMLRHQMRKGLPIRDSFVNPKTGEPYQAHNIKKKGIFLNAERHFLKSRNWKYRPQTQSWHPPTQGKKVVGAVTNSD